jgi:transglutaminase-like putative cysteine protease
MLLKNGAQKVRAEKAPHFPEAGFWLAGCIFLMALGWGAGQCRGQEAKPDEGPPAKWVAPILFDPRARLEAVDPSQDMRWILKDRQINAQNNEIFHHEVRQVLTLAGVKNGSHISIDYDPSYQLLTFHWVRIWRGTNSLNRLDIDKIQVSQHGLDFDELLFSDEKSALLLLEDVRIGDSIDYAYTVQGDNPVFAGRFADEVEVQSSHPIERTTTRLLWPAGRRLYVQNNGTDLKYTAVRKGELVEFTWNLKRVPGWRNEPPLPIWYQPLPWVQLSEFQKWSDVNQLALGLFTNTMPLSPELTQKINQWKRLPGREERLLAALRFVQDEIRYLGIESGISGYRPAVPSTVFARRFGDCKDKTFLLVTILHALGIDAHPTLVNTRLRQSVFALHPSATIFNHAITQVNLEGGTYWLDATANYERGPLSVRSWPNYGYGLVVRPGTTALTPIAPSTVLPKTTVTQYIHLGPLDQQSELRIVTVAEGPDAEGLRGEYATTPRDEIERRNVNYYAKFYPDIAQTAPLIYTDDEQQNKIEVDEFYGVGRIWSHLPDETFYHCRIYPENIETAMIPPTVSLRTMPLGVTYPEHQIFRAEVTVPTLALIKPDDQTIENPAFYFHRVAGIVGGKLSLYYEYRALADAVQAEAVPYYVRQLDSAAELMGYTVPSD